MNSTMNSTVNSLTVQANESSASLFAEPLPFKVTKIVLYVLILIFGTVGNTMIILIICKFKHMKKTPGNLFILNLAVCDLLTPLISIPVDLALVENNYVWHLGPVLCKVLPPVMTFIATVSPLTLAAISLDRYRTLLHPFKRRLDKRTVKIFIALVHICSGILVLPNMITLELYPDGYCKEVWLDPVLSKMYTFVLFLGQYALPLAFMATMYIVAARSLFASTQRARSMSLNSGTNSAMSTGKRSRNGSGQESLSLNETLGPREANSYDSLQRHFRRESLHNVQVTKMFIVIVVVFAILTLPLEVLWIWSEFFGGNANRYYPTIAVVCRLFTYANSCFNPFIFYKFSRDFHKGFLTFFNKCSPCCEDKDALKQTQRDITSGSATWPWDRNGVRTRTPSWLTPRGSLQSTYSAVSCTDQETTSDKKTEHHLTVPHSVFHSKSLAMEMFNRILIDKQLEATKQRRDIADSLHGSVLKVASTCAESIRNNNCNVSINVFLCDGNVSFELENLESLTILPQTDC